MLTIRRRGSAGKWYIRGTVTLGDRFIDVAEFSTGTPDEDAARHVMLERERCLREELMFGPRAAVGRKNCVYKTGDLPTELSQQHPDIRIKSGFLLIILHGKND